MSFFRLCPPLAAAVLLAPAPTVRATATAPEPLTITVHADRPGARISPNLYGVFFEEINHAGDGGLYAELVRNRDFEEKDRFGHLTGWAVKLALAKLSVDTSRPLNAVTPRSLRLDVTGDSASVVNTGYWGIPARKGASYNLSLFASRNDSLRGPITATLERADGTVYGRAVINGLTTEWKRFTAKLTSNADDPNARLVLTVSGPGTLWLDMVSLFPADTWKKRSNGLRADLAEHVNAMKPAFLRFPGGCYVEGGDRLADRFIWKNTIGDIAERPGHLNATWNYRSTDGLGYHEYLQMCEDMGAEALFVVNCGMSHREFIPVDQLQPWIQDALDAIEYANGPVTSKWGAERAKNGHPKPFNLKYVEIGNENGSLGSFGGTRQQYAERYRPFYDAIKSKYPQIVTIADTIIPHPIEMVDDHYYNSPGWFWVNAGIYDRYDRSRPKVYVGEYAVTSDCGKGNLKAALAEAAFMAGFERNADVVVMSSYAPLFVNVNDRKWNPDAICFDSASSYGTPSYHVQKLFAENRPDVALPTEVSDIPLKMEVSKGGIGLGTWRTQAEYKDIVVTQNGRTLYSESFANGAPGWRGQSGDWKAVDGVYRQSAGGDNRRAYLTSPALADQSDYTLQLKARKLGGDEGFLIIFRARNPEDIYWWNIGGWINREHGLERIGGGVSGRIGEHVFGRIETGRWYDIKIELEGPRIRCYLDGKLIHDVTERPIPMFAAVAGKTDKTGEIVVKVVNGSDEERTATLNLEDAGRLQPNGTAITLTSASLEDENSLEQPKKVAPTSKRISGVGPKFSYTFPARSLTILRLRTR
jgi:alpha-L-arabinofuranosidase